MFPDFKIAKGYQAARTKTWQLIGKLARETKAATVKEVQEHPFSLSTDGSNDKGGEQLYPILLRYHDNKKVKNSMLAITTPIGNSTGRQIFEALDRELTKFGLSWDNCLSFGADNASVMLGRLNGVAACIKVQNANVHVQGCPCHLLHIAAKQGAAQLRCPVEERLVDIYYYLENSTKRQKALQGFQMETGTAMRKIIKHGPTRWLSLINSIGCLLEQWDALNAFFAMEAAGKKITDRLSRITGFLKNPSSRLYLHFLGFVLPMFTKANLLFQREDPVLHLMQGRLHEVATDLLVVFIKPKVITGADDLYNIDLHRRSRQKDREELSIGEQTRTYMADHKDALTNTMINLFFEDVRAFFGKSTHYVLSKLPMKKEELQHAVVMDVSKRGSVGFKDIRFWLERFPVLRKELDVDALQAEFAKYQIDKLEELDMSTRVDVLWASISDMRDASGLLKYGTLGKVMKGLLAIPHSNADSERVFSLLEYLEQSRNVVVSALVIKIQSMLRMYLQKTHYKKSLQAVKSIQAHWRGFSQRKQMKKLQVAAACIQRNWRAYRLMMAVKKLFYHIQVLRRVVCTWIDRHRQKQQNVNHSCDPSPGPSAESQETALHGGTQVTDSAMENTLTTRPQTSYLEAEIDEFFPQESISETAEETKPGNKRLRDNGKKRDNDDSVCSEDSGVVVQDDTSCPSFCSTSDGAMGPPPPKRLRLALREYLHFGNQVVTCRQLTEPGLRFHTRKSVLQYGHVAHHKHLVKGLPDALAPDGDGQSENKENTH